MSSKAQDEVGLLPPQLKYSSLVSVLRIPGLTGTKDSGAVCAGTYLESQCLEG